MVHVRIGSVYAWSTFNRAIRKLFPDAPWWFGSPPLRPSPPDARRMAGER